MKQIKISNKVSHRIFVLASIAIASTALAQSNSTSQTARPTTQIGGQETHGGDPVQSQFIQLGRYAVQHLRRLKSATRFQNIDPNIVSETVEHGSAPVPVPTAIQCGHLTNAPACYNSSTRQIQFNTGIWATLNPSQRFELAAHEYFRRAGYSQQEDTYQFSTELARLVPSDQIASTGVDFCPTNVSSCVFTRHLTAEQLRYHDLGIDILPHQSFSIRLDRVTLTCPSRWTRTMGDNSPDWYSLRLSGNYFSDRYSSDPTCIDCISMLPNPSTPADFRPRTSNARLAWSIEVGCLDNCPWRGWSGPLTSNIVSAAHSASFFQLDGSDPAMTRVFRSQLQPPFDSHEFAISRKSIAFVSSFNMGYSEIGGVSDFYRNFCANEHGNIQSMPESQRGFSLNLRIEVTNPSYNLQNNRR